MLHDETAIDPAERIQLECNLAEKGETLSEEDKVKKVACDIQTADSRKELDEKWVLFKYQPMWKIRNYFGEKIALYFSWSGTLITSLWIPTLFGIAVFLYGLIIR